MAGERQIRMGIKGSRFRTAKTDRVLFERIILDQNAQKSHILPRQIAEANEQFFRDLRGAKLPNGELPFDWQDFAQNGQPLPSKATNVGEIALYEASQHSGSHPVITDVMRERFEAIRNDLNAVLANGPTPGNPSPGGLSRRGIGGVG